MIDGMLNFLQHEQLSYRLVHVAGVTHPSLAPHKSITSGHIFYQILCCCTVVSRLNYSVVTDRASYINI